MAEYAWSQPLSALPEHPTVQFFREAPEDEEDRVVLRVARATLKDCPQPSEELVPWLRSGWKKYETKEASLLQSGELSVSLTEEFAHRADGPAEATDPEPFSYPEHILQAFEDWQQERQEWRVQENPAWLSLKLFDRLFHLKGQLDKEGGRTALTLGEGILHWVTEEERRVEHPLLSRRCSLSFDANIPRFEICLTEEETQFPTTLLREVKNAQLGGVHSLVEELRQENFDPLGPQAQGFLRRLVPYLWSNGLYLDGTQPVPRDQPTVRSEPVLFLEPRGRGYVDAADHLRNALDTFEIPIGLQRLVGVASGESDKVSNSTRSSDGLLFTKPTNLEQERVAQRLQNTGTVLVQGPPGTGKTHTIANLIGHLLAQGKSILVTSHTAKALSVLREKVAPQLQGLCVAVLDDGRQGQDMLKAAVQAIANKRTEISAEELGNRANKLQQRRVELQQGIDETERRLLEAMTTEYLDIVVAGQGTKPSDAARKLREWKGTHDWIPGPVRAEAPCALSAAEVKEVYQLQASVPVEDERLLKGGLPELEKLISPEDFEQLLSAEDRLKSEGISYGEEFWKTESSDLERLQALRTQVEEASSAIEGFEEWLFECLLAGTTEETSAAWRELATLIDETRMTVTENQALVLRHGPKVGSLPFSLKRQIEICDQFLEQLASKGKVGFLTVLLSKEKKLFRAACKVEEEDAKTEEDFRAIRALLTVEDSRQSLISRWRRQMEPLGAPPLSEATPERAAEPLGIKILEAVNWEKEVWSPLQTEAENVGLDIQKILSQRPPDDNPYASIRNRCGTLGEEIPKTLAARINALRLDDLRASLKQTEEQLDNSSSPLAERLKSAVASRTPDEFRQAWNEIRRLESLKPLFVRRTDLLKRLGTVASTWSDRIRKRSAPHQGPETPGNLKEAWLYVQWSQQIEERASADLDTLQKKLGDLKSQLRETTADYVESLTWKAQAERTGLKEQQALTGWMQMVEKIGKGKGKMAPVYKARAREQLKECRSAVPVWIMPFARVVESYRPGETKFDVVIVDEASQAGVTGVLALALGKEAIVVGDKEQVSPRAIGERPDKVLSLADQHLQNVPGRELFTGTSSVYDMAERAFGETIRLREHFRCVPEIIEFSNRLCYENEILPLRESDNTLQPAVVSHRVSGIRRNPSKTNDVEAREIATLIGACIERPEYRGKTFGVISLLGDNQADLIHKYLKEILDHKTLDERRIVCGNSAQFQGDERDIMFLSMVDSPSVSGPLRLRNTKGDRQYYNVAASRAKDQMWIIHSLNPSTDLKPDDIRGRLLKAASVNLLDSFEEKAQEAESVFEQQVLKALLAEGYRVIPQLPIGSLRVDLVVLGEKKRVAIECDGDKYHPPEKLEEDIRRQAVIERVAGLIFIRLRGSTYFRDPKQAMKQVFTRLDELGIEKLGPIVLEPKVDQSSLNNELVLRAGELQRQWWPETQSQEVEHDEELEDLDESEPEQESVEQYYENTNLTHESGGKMEEVTELLETIEVSSPTNGHPTVVLDDVEKYQPYQGPRGPYPDPESIFATAKHLLRIVAQEEPVVASRAYQVYLELEAGEPLPKKEKGIFNRALRLLVDKGEVMVKDEEQTGGYLYSTLRLRHSRLVKVRTRGPRTFDQIPLTEIAAVLERLAETRERESEELYRAAYSFYAIEDPGDEDRERLRKAMSWAPQVGAQY